ncbi:MAG: response regulator transcription factor [Zoogloea sp.]|nr:response regulator transcription factor [Zoogloea sp.]
MNTAPPAPPTIYIVDDDASVRESLSSLLRAEGMRAVCFDSPVQFLAATGLDDNSCVVLDVRMPELDGLMLQEKLNAARREIPVIFISGHSDVPEAVRAMKAGAIDFLQKPFTDTDLLGAIGSALSRQAATADDRLAIAALRTRYEALTPREKEIMREVAHGKQNKLIAHELGVTESTVKVHRHNVMAKMRLKSLPELTLAQQRLSKRSGQ